MLLVQRNEFSFCHNCDIELMLKCEIMLSQWKTIFQLRATIFDFRVVVVSCSIRCCVFFLSFLLFVSFVLLRNEVQNLRPQKNNTSLKLSHFDLKCEEAKDKRKKTHNKTRNEMRQQLNAKNEHNKFLGF